MEAKHLEKVKDLRRRLHRNAEVSNHEKNTKRILMDFFRRETGLMVVDRGQWFYVKHEGKDGTKRIAFRAEMDAVMMAENLDVPHRSLNPEAAHKCGHDGHAASLAGLGLELERLRTDRHVYLVFQHAEETGEGAKVCAGLMAEEGIDEIFAYHNMSGMPLNSIGVIEGTAHYASKGMVLRFIGLPTHASQPEHGINPAYALARVVSTLPEIESDKIYGGRVAAALIGIDVGSRAFGIAAGEGELMLTIRGVDDVVLAAFQERIKNYATGVCQEAGLRFEFAYQDEFPSTVNQDSSIERIRGVAKNGGLNLIELEKPFRASEDFGYFLKETSGAIFYIGNGTDYPELHTYGYDFNEAIIETAVEVFKELIGR